MSSFSDLLPVWLFVCNSRHVLQQILRCQLQFLVRGTFKVNSKPVGAQRASAGLTRAGRQRAKLGDSREKIREIVGGVAAVTWKAFGK